MPRALWSGSLSFGLVNVPVALLPAARDTDVHFHQLHEPDGARIEVRRFCAKEDAEVAFEDVGHAYETDGGKTVVLTDAELAAIAPQKTRTIEIGAFVATEQIDPILYDHPYWLLPTGDSAGTKRAYRLLVEAMAQTDRVALGRFVLRTKEHLVAVRVRDRLLSLTTMSFPDEIRPTKGIDTGARKPSADALKQAVELVEALGGDFDPKAYKDEYTKNLRRIVKDKQKGGTIEAPEPDEEPPPAPDLLDALRRSMAEIRKRG